MTMNNNADFPTPTRRPRLSSDRLYRMLLVAYPAAFRHEYGDDLTQAFRDMVRDARQTRDRSAVLQVWLQTVIDLVTTAARQRFENLQTRLQKGSAPMPYQSFDYQLGSTIKSLTVLLRGGYSVAQSFNLLVEQSPEPTASEFRAVLRDVEGGMSWIEALNNLQARVSSEHFAAVIATMMQQFQEGGNLADRLEPVAQTLYQTVGDDAAAQAALRHFQALTANGASLN